MRGWPARPERQLGLPRRPDEQDAGGGLQVEHVPSSLNNALPNSLAAAVVWRCARLPAGVMGRGAVANVAMPWLLRSVELDDMERTSFAEMSCSMARTLEVVGDWWTLLIIRDVFMGTHRFDDFERSLGVARNILSTRLRSLVDSGILERRPYQTRPERFEYVLTEKGVDLFPIVVALIRWGDLWEFGSKPAPVAVVHRSCGHDSQAQTVCSHCGSVLHADDVDWVYREERIFWGDRRRQKQQRSTAKRGA